MQNGRQVEFLTGGVELLGAKAPFFQIWAPETLTGGVIYVPPVGIP